jgi:hypothetical protein
MLRRESAGIPCSLASKQATGCYSAGTQLFAADSSRLRPTTRSSRISCRDSKALSGQFCSTLRDCAGPNSGPKFQTDFAHSYYTWGGSVLDGTPIESDQHVGFDWKERRSGAAAQRGGQSSFRAAQGCPYKRLAVLGLDRGSGWPERQKCGRRNKRKKVSLSYLNFPNLGDALKMSSLRKSSLTQSSVA